MGIRKDKLEISEPSTGTHGVCLRAFTVWEAPCQRLAAQYTHLTIATDRGGGANSIPVIRGKEG